MGNKHTTMRLAVGGVAVAATLGLAGSASANRLSQDVVGGAAAERVARRGPVSMAAVPWCPVRVWQHGRAPPRRRSTDLPESAWPPTAVRS